MKKVITIIALSSLLTSCTWYKVGSLTIVGTRNIDSKTEYVLKQKEVEGVSKLKSNDAIGESIDNAVKKIKDGEFMKNTKVYVNKKGTKIKVIGDVWGTK